MSKATTWMVAGSLAFGLILGFFGASPLQNWLHRNDDPVYAVVDGEPIRASQVHSTIQSDLDELEKNQYRLKRKATEDRIRDILAAREEKNRLPENLPISISKDEIARFLKSQNINAQKISRNEYDRILNQLRIQKHQAEQAEKISELKKNVRIIWKLNLPPEKQFIISKNDLTPQGPRSAPVELLLVSNYQCAFCSEAEKRLIELKEKYKDQLRIHYIFYFNEPDDSLVKASAEASYCAQAQNKFWVFHDALVAHPPSDVKGLIGIAAEKGLNQTEFETCVLQRKMREKVEKDLETLNRSGLPGAVPGLLINGKWRGANLPMEELSPVIDQDISK